MKEYFTFLLILLMGTLAFSQTGTSAVNLESFEKSGFPFKGKRVIQVDNVYTPSEENMFVFSKNEKGAAQDSLYIQQFKKSGDEWKLAAEKIIAKKGIITATWNSRKAFFDADKDGVADVLYIFARHAKEDMETPLSVGLLLIYKNNFYVIENTAEANYDPQLDIYEAGFEELPKAVIDTVEEYWEGLDKQH